MPDGQTRRRTGRARSRPQDERVEAPESGKVDRDGEHLEGHVRLVEAVGERAFRDRVVEHDGRVAGEPVQRTANEVLEDAVDQRFEDRQAGSGTEYLDGAVDVIVGAEAGIGADDREQAAAICRPSAAGARRARRTSEPVDRLLGRDASITPSAMTIDS